MHTKAQLEKHKQKEAKPTNCIINDFQVGTNINDIAIGETKKIKVGDIINRVSLDKNNIIIQIERYIIGFWKYDLDGLIYLLNLKNSFVSKYSRLPDNPWIDRLDINDIPVYIFEHMEEQIWKNKYGKMIGYIQQD